MKKYTNTKISCYTGYFVQAIINNWLPILFVTFQNVYGFSYERLGRIILVNFSVQIVADFSSVYITKAIGFKKSAILSQVIAAIGFILMGFLPTVMSNKFAAMIISVIVYAYGSGFMEVILSPIMELLPSDNKSGAMCFLHSMYCWGQAVTVILTSVLLLMLGSAKWYIIPLLWSIIPIIDTILFIKVPVIEPDPETEQNTSFRRLFNGEFLGYMVFMLCAGASEISMAQWASTFSQNALGISQLKGDILGPCLFALFMGSGRILFGLLSKKVKFCKIFLVCSLLCVVCYVTAGLSNNHIVALLACGFCGITVSAFWPGTYSLSAKQIKNGGTLMYSIFALCGDMGCSLGPWILGLFADKLSLNAGFVFSSIWPLIMAVTALLLMKKEKEII